MRAVLVLLLALAVGLVVAPLPAQAAAPEVTVSLRVSDSSPVKGEMVWVRGKVRTAAGRSPVQGAKVRVERRVGNSWVRVKSRTTNKNGNFRLRIRPDSVTTLRARVVKTARSGKARSPLRTIWFDRSDRTLEERAAELGKRTGKAKNRATSAMVTKKKRATWRNFAKVMLVEVAGPKKTRTWLVEGDIREAYRKAGGPDGRLGAPLADPRCGLLEAGCVQRFQGGAIYDNKNTKKATIVYAKGRRTEVLAAAMSQTGYREPRSRASKFNSWIRSTGQPWCSAFVSWAAVAAGAPKSIPKHARLRQLWRDLRANAPGQFGSTPKKGALVFYDNDDDGVREPTHIGIVLKVNKSTITTVEGNTTNPATRSGRGVYKKVRAKSHPMYYWYPRY